MALKLHDKTQHHVEGGKPGQFNKKGNTMSGVMPGMPQNQMAMNM